MEFCKFVLVFAFVFVLNGFQTAVGAEIFATDLEGLVQQDKNGLYDQVLKIMNIKSVNLPAARAESNAKAQKGCIFPLDQRFFKFDGKTIQSNPIDIININIYSFDKQYNNLSELKGKRVGLRNGLNYGPKIEKSQSEFKSDLTQTLDSNLKKLEAGRLDAVIEFEIDVDQYKEKNFKFKSLKKSAAPVETHNDAVTCVDNDENRKVINEFNLALKKNRKEIDKLIGK